MSAMSASPVKPILPPTGVTASPPKVVPPSTTSATVPSSLSVTACNLTNNPLKNSGMNHSPVALSLISENKVTPQPTPLTVPSVQPLPRTPEKPKEPVTVSMNNISPKVTSNGVQPPPATVPNESPLTPATPKENVVKPEVTPTATPVKPVTENHAPEASAPPSNSNSVTSNAVPKSESSVAKTTPALVTSKPEKKPEIVSPEKKTPEKALTTSATTPTVAATPISTTSNSSLSSQTSATTSSSSSSTPTTTSTSTSSSSSSSSSATPVTSTEKSPSKAPEPVQKPEIKVATIPRTPKRKAEPKTPEPNRGASTEERKSKRTRLPTQPYQSPLPELSLITKMTSKSTPSKKEDDKLIVFYKNEFLAVRNAEGGFYVCQSMQNIYRSSSKIRIRWLSQNSSGVYIPDFYDHSDFECILTCLALERVDKDKWKLPEEELLRTENILKRALDVEKGVAEKPSVTEEHPDGLDLSLFRDESQLKKSRKSAKKATASPAEDKPESNSAPKKDEEKKTDSTPPKPEQNSKKKPIAKSNKKAPLVKKAAAKNTAVKAPAAAQPVTKKPADTKKAAARRKAPKTASPSTSFSSLTPAEKRRKVIENLTKQVSSNDRSSKTRSAGGAVAAKISSAALKMVITKDRDRRNVAAARKK